MLPDFAQDDHEDRRAPSPRQEAVRQWPLQVGPSVPAPAAQPQGSCADPAGRERVPASGNRECCGPANRRWSDKQGNPARRRKLSPPNRREAERRRPCRERRC